MIKVFPKYDPDNLDRSLTAQFIFKDSKGDRQTLNPAESMESLGKVAQDFDGEDYAVAFEIMKHVKAKTVTVSAGDKAILVATIKAGPADGSGEKPVKATKTEIREAVAETNEAHEIAMGKAADEAADAQTEAVKTAVAEAGKAHEQALGEAADAATDAQSEAVKEAVAEAGEEYLTAIDEVATQATADKEKALAEADEAHGKEIETLNAEHEQALAKAAK